MNRLFGVVAAQVAPVPFDPEATWAKFEREVRLLSRLSPQLDLYVFPELYLSATGTYGDDYPAGYERRVAEEIPGPLTEQLSALARSVGRWIVPGSIFERSGDRIHNTALVFAPDGTLHARYRKVFPWMPYEQTDPGDEYVTFDIPDVGRFGLAICYDGWIPEIMRALAWQGAEVIIQPTLTQTVDREQELIIARANAITNQVYVINPNYGRLFGTGRSVVVDPEGRVLAQGGSGEEFLTVTVDLDLVRAVRETGTARLNPVWKQLRDFPPPAFPQYTNGRFVEGEMMRGLGSLRPERSRVTAGGNGEDSR
ncbi:MAG: carbon-nitrogen hydrolase family protein [Chloroflexi bacterium]|nr:carbon-nitrogen hydrolase family protein [Chloroflexota bacterium]